MTQRTLGHFGLIGGGSLILPAKFSSSILTVTRPLLAVVSFIQFTNATAAASSLSPRKFT